MHNATFITNTAPRAESGELLGRWRRSRGIGGEIVIATKVGRPRVAQLEESLGAVDLELSAE